MELLHVGTTLTDALATDWAESCETYSGAGGSFMLFIALKLALTFSPCMK